MIYSYRQLLNIYKRDEIEDMIRFNILNIVSRNNYPSSFKLKFNSIYPIKDLTKKRKEEIKRRKEEIKIKQNNKILKKVEKEWELSKIYKKKVEFEKFST